MSSDVDARLEKVQAKLGKKLAFRKPPPKQQADDDDSERPVYSSNKASSSGASSSQPKKPRARRGSGRPPPQPRGTNSQPKSSATLGKATSNAQKTTWWEVDPVEKAPELGFEYGKNVPESFEFVAWRVVRTYPVHYVGKANGPSVKRYFDKIYELQRWDFFYLFDPQKPQITPRLLVPTTQLEALLDLVNERLDIHLRIPKGSEEAKFRLRFGQGGTPRPRYLRFTDKESLDYKAPAFSEDDAACFEAATRQQQHDWRVAWKLMVAKDDPEKKRLAQEKAERKKKARNDMMNNVQKLLGLLEWPVDERAVFVCIDAEALERYPHPVSEIGVAILDLQDIIGVEPGPCAQRWWDRIKCYHFRTYEYAGLRNHQFVQGCPDAFDFGTFPTKAQLAGAVHDAVGNYLDTDRQLFLVGHDVGGDIGYLSSIGCDIMAWKNLVGRLDSQALHQAWKESTQGRSLKMVLSDLGILYKHLHNAGNDAMFTLRALLGLAIEHIDEAEAKKSNAEYTPALLKGAPA